MNVIRQQLRRAPAAVAIALVAVLTGCGGDADEVQEPLSEAQPEGQPEAQPAPNVTTFQEGDFGEIPLPPRYTEVSERTEEQGVVSQSFEVRNMTPEEILDFYVEALSEAELLDPPVRIGVDTYRGQWEIADGRQLTVAAQPAPALDDNPGAPEVLSQLSLSLAPAGVETSPS